MEGLLKSYSSTSSQYFQDQPIGGKGDVENNAQWGYCPSDLENLSL